MIGNLTRNTVAVVLAGGKAEQMGKITANRPNPLVDFGGKYKVIDFALSNLFNSGIMKIFVVTQYRAHQLNKHIKEFWSRQVGMLDFVDTFSPEIAKDSEAWFRGTADAIYRFLNFLDVAHTDYIAVFSGDQIYKMDVSQMIDFHVMNRADLTVASLAVRPEDASRYGIFTLDENHRAESFEEKPAQPRLMPDRDVCIASMGNYIFSTEKLVQVLNQGRKQHADLDFGRHVIPAMIQQGDRVFAYNFLNNLVSGMKPDERGYWRDVGTVDAYYAANMDLIGVTPRLNLYNYRWPILTNQGNFPPAKTEYDEDGLRGENISSYVSGGCVTSGAVVKRSILGPCCSVSRHSLVEDSILFRNVEVGSHVKIRRAIIDEGLWIKDGTVIGHDHELDRENGYTVTDSGIVLVMKGQG